MHRRKFLKAVAGLWVAPNAKTIVVDIAPKSLIVALPRIDVQKFSAAVTAAMEDGIKNSRQKFEKILREQGTTCRPCCPKVHAVGEPCDEGEQGLDGIA